MKNLKLGAFVFVIAVTAGLVYKNLPQRGQHIPADLRDAVADNSGFDTNLKGPENIPVPGLSAPQKTFGYGAATKNIYGDDDRLDYYQAAPAMRLLADSVVSLWSSEQVQLKNGEYQLETIEFGKDMNLCPGEQFREQPTGAFCSGTLVGEDIIMTAGHCITNKIRCADTKFVFGYNIPEEGGAARTTVPAKDLYSCKRIIKRNLGKKLGIISLAINAAGRRAPDYALVQLDRKVTDRAPLAVNRAGDAKPGDSLFTIGHPVGLPVKIAGSAIVRRDTYQTAYLTTDLDAFGGNSGGAVFNADTNLIEGIVVRGEPDFMDSPAGCRVVRRLRQDQGFGTDVTKISMLREYIPAIGSPGNLPLEVLDMPVGNVPAAGEELSGKIQF